MNLKDLFGNTGNRFKEINAGLRFPLPFAFTPELVWR